MQTNQSKEFRKRLGVILEKHKLVDGKWVPTPGEKDGSEVKMKEIADKLKTEHKRISAWRRMKPDNPSATADIIQDALEVFNSHVEDVERETKKKDPEMMDDVDSAKEMAAKTKELAEELADPADPEWDWKSDAEDGLIAVAGALDYLEHVARLFAEE